jgi:hypothetical protein
LRSSRNSFHRMLETAGASVSIIWRKERGIAVRRTCAREMLHRV